MGIDGIAKKKSTKGKDDGSTQKRADDSLKAKDKKKTDKQDKIDRKGKGDKIDKKEKGEKLDGKGDKLRKGGKQGKDGVVKAAGPSTSTKKEKKPPRVVKKKEEDFYADIDLPPSESEEEYEKEEVEKNEEIQDSMSRTNTAKDIKKQKKVEQTQAMAAEMAKREAYMDDTEAFSVSVAGGGDQKVATADANARDIKIEKFSVSVKGKELFKNTDLTVAFGRRYGLVGPNGKGKSTVMKLIARRMLPVPDNLDVLLVEQEVIGDERTALDAVMHADEELTALRKEEEKLNGEEETEDTEMTEADLSREEDAGIRLKEIHERIEELGGSTAESRASKILSGLGFTPIMQGRQTASFSGGWRMRISLARALFMLPSVLLLDEPTNHLDLRAVLWLEEYLQRWKKTLLIVSHDRDFLNSVCTDIVHLHDMKLQQYRGNFDSFEKMYEQRRREQNKLYDKYVSDMRKAKTSKAAQDKAKDKARNDRERRAKRSGKTKNDEDDDQDQKEEPVSKWTDYSVNFSFPEPTELGHPLLQLMDCEFQYPGREDFKLSKVNVGIGMGTRAAIVGPNGAGKSTFMNLLAGELDPTDGEFRKKPKLRVGRYSQHFVDVLNMEVSPVQYLQQLYPDEFAGSKGQQQLRGRLGRFGLSGAHHLTPIAKLSGGQKARVVFTMIALMQPHILLLDEPTNNLDMESIDALGDAVSSFEGGVVIISHDSRLIAKVCEDELSAQLWVVDNGTVSIFNGTFEDYRDVTIKEIIEELGE